jgi:hypothetical protein
VSMILCSIEIFYKSLRVRQQGTGNRKRKLKFLDLRGCLKSGWL